MNLKHSDLQITWIYRILTPLKKWEFLVQSFTRLIEKARKKIATFIITGEFHKIDCGNIHFRKNIIYCKDCGHRFIINFKDTINECPACQSENILNLAGGFGHGECCEKHVEYFE